MERLLHKNLLFGLEYTGFEPVASTMRMLRAPNCANTPWGTAPYRLSAVHGSSRFYKKEI